MRYYSRSPREMNEHNENLNAKRQTLITRSRMILLVDLILVIILAFFFHSIMKDKKTDKVGGTKTFQWRDWQLNAFCENSGECSLKINTKELINIPFGVVWNVKDQKDKIIVEEKVLLEKVDVEGQSYYVGKFNSPTGLEFNQVFAQLTDSNEKELIMFRVYP